MKYKIRLFFCTFIICCTFYCIKTYAYDGTIIIYGDPDASSSRCISYTNGAVLRYVDNDYYIYPAENSSFIGYAQYPYLTTSFENYITRLTNNQIAFNYTGTYTRTKLKTNCEYIYVYQGTFTNSSDFPDYRIEDPNAPTPTPTITPSPSPSWYKEMWDTLGEALGSPEFWFGEWFVNIIDNVFGDDENEPTGGPSPPSNSTHVKINNPSITPAPTPIPYTTVVIPKTDPITGDTFYETNYYYTNPSGTPIITSQPPTQSPSQNGTNGGNGDYNPIDPYAIPQISWLTNATILSGSGGTLDGIGSIGQGMDSIDEIGYEYNDGMSAVQDSTGTLPTSWLLLIGIAAAIPLLAGIISRFLGG